MAAPEPARDESGIDWERLGRHLREIRMAAGFTVESVAERLGRSHSAVLQWEKGVNQPGLGQLAAMGRLFGFRGLGSFLLALGATEERELEDPRSWLERIFFPRMGLASGNVSETNADKVALSATDGNDHTDPQNVNYLSREVSNVLDSIALPARAQAATLKTHLAIASNLVRQGYPHRP